MAGCQYAQAGTVLQTFTKRAVVATYAASNAEKEKERSTPLGVMAGASA